MNNIKKEVNFYDRILCFLLAASVTSAFVLCSISCPLCASAGDASPLDAATVIDQFAEDVYTAKDRVTQAVREDFENGNVDATSALGRQYLLAIALQTAAVNNPQVNAAIQLAQAYEDGQAEAQDWLDWYNSNQTLTISASYISGGYYKLSHDGELRMCNVYTFPDWSSSNFGSTFIVADDYSYSIVTDNPSTCECRCYNDNYNGSLFYEFQLRVRATNMYPETHISLQGSGIGASITDWMGFANGSGTSARNISFRGTDRGALYIPVYSSINPLYGFPDPLFACGVYSDIPSSEVDTSTVYDYYNDTILPLVKEKCPDVPDNYYFFYGDEYEYGPAQDPTEPPLPDGNNGGVTVNNNWNFNIGINNITVTDASGQPVTDASGETVTETVIETETRPTDAVYHFQIPTLTPLETQVATIPPYEVPVEYAGYMGNMFTAITDFIDDAGLTDIAPVFLALAGIGIVIGVLL